MPSSRRARASLIPVFAAVVAVVLAGCASVVDPIAAEKPAATPSAEPSPTPTPTEIADPLESATELVVRPAHLDVLDASGTVVAELSYDLPTDELVGALATVFGSTPELETYEATYYRPETDRYLWDGFDVYDDLSGYLDGEVPEDWVWVETDEPDFVDMNVEIIARRPVVGDIEIRTAEGYRPGDDFDWVDSIEGNASTRHPEWFAGQRPPVALETGPEIGERFYDEAPNAYSVVFFVARFDPPIGEATQVKAPWNIGVPF